MIDDHQCLVWASNMQVMLHTWIYSASPPLIVSGRGLSANVGPSIIIIHIIEQEVGATANGAVGYFQPEGMESVRLYV